MRRWEIKWQSVGCWGWEHVSGEAFGCPLQIEVFPCGELFRWRLNALNQATTGTRETRDDARAAAIQTAARWLLNQALDAEFLALATGSQLEAPLGLTPET